MFVAPGAGFAFPALLFVPPGPFALNRPTRIEPRTLKGFRDYLPATMIPRERIIDIARCVYRSYGFSPIDTPALEYLEILTGKGGEEPTSSSIASKIPASGGSACALT